MDKIQITFEVKKSQGIGFEARAIGHSIFTEAKDFKDIEDNIKDALACHFNNLGNISFRIIYI